MLVRRDYTPDEIKTVDRRIRKTCYSKQAAFVFDLAQRVSLLTGRGAGKTSAALMRLVRTVISRPEANGLYVASTRDSAKRLAWLDLKKIIGRALKLPNVKWNETELSCSLPNGSTIRLFGADGTDDINRLRGITYHALVLDETANIRKDILTELLDEIIGPRMVGWIAMIGTPGKVLQGDFFEATAPQMAGRDEETGAARHRPYTDRDLPEYADWDGWSSHAWNITDGVEAGIQAMIEIYAEQLKTKKRKGWADNNPIWLREYMGVWAADNSINVYIYRAFDEHGAEFNQWDPKRDDYGYAILPKDFKEWRYGIGIDVGFSDAFALEIFAWSYSDLTRTLYHVYEVYRTKLYANAIAKLLIGEDLNHKKYGGIFGRIGWPDVMVGDYAGRGGDLITELATVYGIPIPAADKPYKYKENSIEVFNSKLFERRIRILKGSKLAGEMTVLQWVVDPWGKRVENKNQANHGCDGAMYICNAVEPLLPLPGPVAGKPPAPKTHDDDGFPVPKKADYRDADSMYAAGDW